MGALEAGFPHMKKQSEIGQHRLLKAYSKRESILVGRPRALQQAPSKFPCGRLIDDGVREYGVCYLLSLTADYKSLYPSPCSLILVNWSLSRTNNEKHPRCLLLHRRITLRKPCRRSSTFETKYLLALSHTWLLDGSRLLSYNCSISTANPATEVSIESANAKSNTNFGRLGIMLPTNPPLLG